MKYSNISNMAKHVHCSLQMENVVEYRIFDLRSISAEDGAKESIQDILLETLSYAQSLIGDYIWQKDSFNLTCQELEKEFRCSESISCLKGSTDFGDNIEDEWFIVYLLFSITKKFPYMVVSVKDDDGEFLLIEAAEYLPKWLEPETSENRVFVYQGGLHIIPLPVNPSEITILPAGKPTIEQALKILKSNFHHTFAFPWIQDSILKKIQDYPKKALESFHHVLCYVPIQVKYLLQRKPSLISPAVLAFIYRDRVDMKTCQKLANFGFESLVPCRIRFTKCLYGQLCQQNFIPDMFAQKLLPPISNSLYKGHFIGLLLSYGFEILYTQEKTHIAHASASNSIADNLWEKYLNSLRSHGYFQNEVVGSCLYSQLLENAKKYFSQINLGSEKDLSISHEIRTLLKEMPVLREEGPCEFPPDDDESWLEVSPETLDSLLSEYGGNKLSAEEDVDLQEVIQGMNSFVKTVSGYEGVEFPSDINEYEEIQFDPDTCIKALDGLLTKPENEEDKEPSDVESCFSDLSESEEYNNYIGVMDRELSATDIGKSFLKMPEENEDKQTCHKGDGDTQRDANKDENVMRPIDVDLNLVKNFLESYTLQEGAPGPVSNILGSLGISLPEDQPSHDL